MSGPSFIRATVGTPARVKVAVLYCCCDDADPVALEALRSIAEADVFILDEPMVGLDPHHARVLKDILKERSLQGMLGGRCADTRAATWLKAHTQRQRYRVFTITVMTSKITSRKER